MFTDELKDRFYQFKVLEHVETSPKLTARMAAAKLGCSVRLTHGLLSKMVSRGLLHVKKIHSRRWDYFLTPKGMAEKARLTYEFLQFSMQFYQEARKRSSQLCRDLKESGVSRVALWGAGDLGEIVYLGIKEWGLELVECYDDHVSEFIGLEVKKTAELIHSGIEDIIDCTYDPKRPMAGGSIPPVQHEGLRFYNIFRDDTGDLPR